MPPYSLYKAKFDVSKVDDVENTMVVIAKRWNLEPFQKDREQMKFLTQNKEAFFIAFYFDGDPVLVVTNVGVGEVLTLSATDYKKMPISDLKKLIVEVIDALKDQFNIEFKKEKLKGSPISRPPGN